VITALVAAAVIIFGVYRIILSRRSDEDDDKARRRGGMYAMPRRTHMLLGVVYCLLGLWLLAEMFGWGPLKLTREAEDKTVPAAPAGGVPIETSPDP
jgi:hypothetical protein